MGAERKIQCLCLPQLDGNLSIKSKKDNKGTVVKILLPKYA